MTAQDATSPVESEGEPVVDSSNDAEVLSTAGVQQELPFAVVEGKPLTNLPQDLYIPPDALEVMLEAFEGPLDLLLYLIRRQNMDILSINVSAITHQYMEYIRLMQTVRFELAAEYLLMAATLAEIKSRILLPRHESEDDTEEDPRAELIRRLQQYEVFKKAAEDMEEIPRMNRDFYEVKVNPPKIDHDKIHPDVSMRELLVAFSEVLRRSDMFESHQVAKEQLSTRERMGQILSALPREGFLSFHSLFNLEEGRMGVVVSFLAMMELIKEQLVEIVQNEVFGEIHLRPKLKETE